MAAGLQPFRNAIVRICSPDWEFVGLGYRLNDELILTCAHVVADALGTDTEATDRPDGTLRVDHPFVKSSAGGASPSGEASVEPGGWFPKGVGDGPSDLALLRLHQPASAPTPLAELSGAQSLGGSRFVAHGGIKRHEENLPAIEGTVRHPIASGRWQLGSDAEYSIEPGCSGGPAADRETGEVLGLIVQDEKDPSIPAGFLIGAGEIRQALERTGVAIRSCAQGLPRVRAWAKRRIPTPAYDEQQGILRFIDYYAGRPDRPMPFAGRDDELTHLDAWWAAESGSFLLVSSPAGMGKSALLLHWLANLLETREATGVLFLPVSIRFGTSDELSGLRLLHAQLAGLFTELRFPPEAKPDPTDYRAKIQEGWRLIANSPGDRYLLVLDGADESAGPWVRKRVLPYEKPENLAIVLSARHKPGHQDGHAWLDEFTFADFVSVAEPLELQPLQRLAVGEAMAQLGHPLDDLIDREEILDELYRLTDCGDPLLVTLWAAQLWEERSLVPRLGAQDLAGLSPGFTGFFEKWLEEQKRVWKRTEIDTHPEDLDRLLGILGFAHGPMRLQDLLEVEVRLDLPTRWSYKAAREVLDNSERLVVGSAEREGYTFVHPRLAEEFRSRIGDYGVESSSIDRGFVAWGRQVIDLLDSEELAPEQCSGYLLRHYTTHVLETGAPCAELLENYLVPLLGRGWHQAWYAEEGSYSGYLGDLSRVKAVLERVNRVRPFPVPYLGEEIRCVLIQCSISSLTQQFPPELVVSLVHSGLWTVHRGLRVSSNFDDRRKSAVIQGLAHRGDGLDTRALDHLLDILDTIREEILRADALVAIGSALGGHGALVERALEAVNTIGDDDARVSALGAVVGQIGKDERLLNHSLRVVEGTREESARARAVVTVLARVVSQLEGQVVLLERALAISGKMRSGGPRGRALAAIVRQVAGQPKLLDLAFAIAGREVKERFYEYSGGLRGEGWLGVRERTLVTMAGKLTGTPELFRRVVEVVGRTKGEWLRARTLGAVSRELHGQPELLKHVVASVDRIRNDGARAWAVERVCETVAGQPDRLERAISSAGKLKSERVRGKFLQKLSGQVASYFERPGGRGAEWQRAMDSRSSTESRSSLREEPSKRAQYKRLEKILSSIEESDADRLRAVESTVEYDRVTDERGRAEILEDMATLLKEHSQLLRRALDAADQIKEELPRARAVAALASQLAGQSPLIRHCLGCIQRLQDERHRAWALEELTSQLFDDPSSLESVLAAVEEIGGSWPRARALSAVAKQLSGQPGLVIHTLEAAADIEDPWLRTGILKMLAGQLGGQVPLVRNTLRTVETVEDERARAEALVALVAEFVQDDSVLEQAFDLVDEIKDVRSRARALEAVSVHLSRHPSLLERAVRTAETIEHAKLRGWVLAAMTRHLTGSTGLLERALRAVGRIDDARRSAQAMAAVAVQLPQDARTRAIEDIFSFVERICPGKVRAQALSVVAGELAGQTGVVTRVLVAAEAIEERSHRAGPGVVAAVSGMLGLQPGLQNEAPRVLDDMGYVEYRARSVAMEDSEAPEEERLLQAALSHASKTEDQWLRLGLIAAVVNKVAKQKEFIESALSVAGRMQDEELWRRLLLALVKSIGGREKTVVRALRARVGLSSVADSRLWAAVELSVRREPQYEDFRTFLDTLAGGKRSDLLSYLILTLPAIGIIGGTSGLERMFSGIVDTADYWP